MGSYVTFSMYGFNREHRASKDGNHFEYTMSENKPYVYKNHPFLDSVYIDDHVTEITFYLQAGKSYKDYMDEIHVELERICFNLISHSELPILQPYCLIKTAINEQGTEMVLSDHMGMRDECYIFKTVSSKRIYESGLEHQTNFAEYEALYKEIFWILHSPYKVIQFMGLYDIMAELIETPISQKRVHDYFGKNITRYPFITFLPSEKDGNKKEDSLTYLRNAIAHSRQAGISKFMEISNSVSDDHIKCLLTVINDLLCEKKKK